MHLLESWAAVPCLQTNPQVTMMNQLSVVISQKHGRMTLLGDICTGIGLKHALLLVQMSVLRLESGGVVLSPGGIE